MIRQKQIFLHDDMNFQGLVAKFVERGISNLFFPQCSLESRVQLQLGINFLRRIYRLAPLNVHPDGL